MKCKICNSGASLFLKEKVMGKYEAEYYRCANCGFMFPGDPFWLDEAYSSAINLTDTGLVERNLYFNKLVSVLIYFFFNKDGKFLDYAGGYGLFTRLMRDTGFDFYWQDPYCSNLLSRGFEYQSEDRKAELLTAFEVFEHLKDPADEFKKMLEFSDSILMSTELISENVDRDWWYFGFEHGQHIAFYTMKALKILAEQNSLNFYSFSGLYLFTKKKINNRKASVLLKLSNRGAFSYVKRRMKSLTWDDYLTLRKT
jgi:hypothetical protein